MEGTKSVYKWKREERREREREREKMCHNIGQA
jgi:hypothetical protein